MNKRFLILIFTIVTSWIPFHSLFAQEANEGNILGGNGDNGGNNPPAELPSSDSTSNNNNGIGGTNSGGSQSIETDEFTGAITNNVTISVPPGKGGIEPQLIINYHSHRKNPNSWVGYGWELDLGQIIRLPQERSSMEGGVVSEVNNVIDPVAGTSFEARFLGQSETLILAKENVDLNEYGIQLLDTTADLYQSKVDSSFNTYLHLKSSSRIGHGIDVDDYGWIVLDKNGKKYHFGRTSKTRDEKSESPFATDESHFGIDRWMLEKVIDANGNELNIEYGDDLLLERISYSDIIIEFQKSDRSKYFPIFRESFLAPTQISRQLDAIIIHQGHERLQKFVLRYKTFSLNRYRYVDEIPDQIFNPGYTYLGSVQQFGKTDDTFLPATTFEYYNQPESDLTKARFGNGVVSKFGGFQNKNAQLADMNGNGFADFIYMSRQKNINIIWDVYERGFQGAEPAGTIWNMQDDSFCTDDKDGVLDWCKDNLTKSFNDNDNAYQKLFLMDMNGDGLPDRVRTHNQSNEDSSNGYVKGFLISFNTSAGWQQPIFWEDPIESYNRKAAGTTTDTAGLIDMNADGLVDRVAKSRDGEGFTVCLNRGYGFQPLNECHFWSDPISNAQQQSAAIGKIYRYQNGEQRALIRDFNGDGLPDRIWKASFYEFGEPYYDRTQQKWLQKSHSIGSGFMVALNRNGEGWASPNRCPRPPEPTNILEVPNPGIDPVLPVEETLLPEDYNCELFQQFNNIDILALKGPLEDEETHFFNAAINKEADLIDMNGDGYLDWVQRYTNGGKPGFKVSYFKGSSPELDFVQYSRFFEIEDPITHRVGEDDGRGYIFKGIVAGDEYNIHTFFKDVNGDGLPDRVSLNLAKLDEDKRDFEMYPLEFNTVKYPENRNRIVSQPAGLLRKIDNGYGQQNGIEYYPALWPYGKDPVANHRFLPLNLFVAHKTYSRDHTIPYQDPQPLNEVSRWPNFRETTYKYEGGNIFILYGKKKIQKYFSQFNGFQKVTKETKPAPGEDWNPNFSVTYYHQSLGEAPLLPRSFVFNGDIEDEQRDTHFSLSGKTYKDDVFEVSERGDKTELIMRQKWRIKNPSNQNHLFACEQKHCLPQLMETKRQVKWPGQAQWRSNTTEYQYDEYNNITLQVDRNGQGAEVLRTVNTYYPQGQFQQNPLVSDRIHNQTQMKGNQSWRTKEFSYDNRGNPIRESYVTNPNQTLELTRQFAPDGNMTNMTDADGLEKELVYDDTGLFPLQEKIHVAGNQFLITQRSYNRLTGKVENETTPGDINHRTVYDDFGRPLEEYIRDSQGNEKLVKKYAYELIESNIDGHNGFNLLKLSVWIPQDGYEETNPASENSKPFKIMWADSGGTVLQECVYSERGNYRQSLARTRNGGRISIKTEPIFSNQCNFISSIPQNLRTFRTEQDFQGRILRQDLPPGDAQSPIEDITYNYAINADGYIQKTTNLPNNQSRVEIFNNEDRLVQLIDSNGNVLNYDFNPVGDLVTIRTNQNNLMEAQYDSMGRKTQVSDPTMGTWKYSYDNQGHLIEQIDNKGQRILSEYTSLGRLKVKRIIKSNGDLEKKEVYTYDQGDGTHDVIVGELFKVEEYDGRNRFLRSTQFGYEPLFRRNNKITKIIPNLGSFEQTIEYDTQGKVIKTTYPSGEDIFYQYNRTGQLDKICQKVTCKLSNNEVYYYVNAEDGYDVYGALLKENFGNGVKSTYTYYDNSHRLRSKSIGTDQKIYSTRNYTYDSNSNITTIQDPFNLQGTSGLQSAQYDNLNRLISYQHQNSPNPIRMQYDEKGNILLNPASFNVDRYQYNGPRPDAVTNIGNVQFTYDGNGNMLTDGERVMSYNAENQMAQVAMNNGVVVNYEYDYSGSRVSKTTRAENPLHQVHTSTTYFLGQALEIKNGNLLLHVYANEGRILSKSLGNLQDIQNSGGSALNISSNYTPPFKLIQLQPYALLFFTLFILISFRPVRAPPAWHRFLIRKSLHNRLQYTIIKNWASYTRSLDQALSQLHRNKFSKFVSLSLILIISIQTPLSSYAQANPQEQQVKEISDSKYLIYSHGDSLGSTHIITEGKKESKHAGVVYKAGDLIQRFEYDPYGKEKYALNPNLSFDARYTGQEYDIETGLYYYNSRYYNPKLSRFIQPDTITPDPKDLQSYNKYSYVHNNPLKYTDPTGHFAFLAFFLAIFAGAAFGAITAAISGGNIGLGALTGALTAAIFYGAGSIIQAAEEAIKGAAQAAQVALISVTKVAVHFVAGAMSGAINAAITGGKVGLGALVGGVSAGLAKGLGEFVPSGGITELLARSFIGGVTGGIAAEMYGGSFMAGFKQGAITAAFAFVFNDVFHKAEKAIAGQISKIMFNGKEISTYDKEGGLTGKYKATSGRTGITNETLKDGGPIPSGSYTFDPEEISEGGFFRSLTGDWGTYRVPLVPNSDTNTYGRSGFFLHGGSFPGSAGCIDIGNADKIIFPILQKQNAPVNVIVGY